MKIKMNTKTKHRIVADNYNGYEVQVKRFIFPFWVQCWRHRMVNSFDNIQDAKDWVEKGKPKHGEVLVIEEF